MGALLKLTDAVLFLFFLVIALAALLIDAQTCLRHSLFPLVIVDLKNKSTATILWRRLIKRTSLQRRAKALSLSMRVNLERSLSLHEFAFFFKKKKKKRKEVPALYT
jgi:hypothetical protein